MQDEQKYELIINEEANEYQQVSLVPINIP